MLLEDTIFKKKDYFEKKSSASLTYKKDQLLTNSFLSEVKKIIGDGKTFKKKTAEEKKKIIKELDMLIESESTWKTLVKKSSNHNNNILTLFKEESYKYNNLIKEHFFPKQKDKKKAASKYGSIKLQNYFEGLILFIKKHNILELEERMDYEEVFKHIRDSELIKHLKTEDLFCELIRISIKVTYDSCVDTGKNIEENFFSTELEYNFLKAKRTDLYYKAKRSFMLYFSNILLTKVLEKNPHIKKNKEDSSIYIISCLKTLEKTINDKVVFKKNSKEFEWYYQISDITMIFLDLLEETDVILKKNIEKTKNLKKTHVIYTFNHKLENGSLEPLEYIPKIVPPTKAEGSACVNDWIAPPKHGTVSVVASHKTLKTLNIAQKKTFKINKRYEDILNSIFENSKINKNIVTKKHQQKYINRFNNWNKSYWTNNLNIFLFNRTVLLNKKKSKGLNYTLKTITQASQVSTVERLAGIQKNNTNVELYIMHSYVRLLKTSLMIARIFKDFTLYYGTHLDFRLRMYPLQYLLSRTSGYLRHLLENFEERTLTMNGLEKILEAYNAPNRLIIEKIQKEILSLKIKKIKLNIKDFQLIHENYSRKLKETDPLYFFLLRDELKNIFKTEKKKVKTSISVEIDQVASGPTLVSLLIGNKALAQKCNLLGGFTFHCIYTELLKETYYFMEEKYIEKPFYSKTSKAFSMLTSKRKSQKHALMCFFYNETPLGRTLRWKKFYEDYYNTNITKEDFELIQQFSIDYPIFLNKLYPKINEQLKLLNEAVKVIIELGLPVTIETLDDTLIEWDFNHVTEIKRNRFNSIWGVHVPYKETKKTEETKQTQKKRLQRHLISFRPNLVHSIDSAIMREIIAKVYEKTKQRINHLHDCVILHPNEVDTFYEVVKDIYCNPKMLEMADNLVFKPFMSKTKGPSQMKLKEIQKKFNKNKDLFVIKESELNPYHLYRYENLE